MTVRWWAYRLGSQRRDCRPSLIGSRGPVWFATRSLIGSRVPNRLAPRSLIGSRLHGSVQEGHMCSDLRVYYSNKDIYCIYIFYLRYYIVNIGLPPGFPLLLLYFKLKNKMIKKITCNGHDTGRAWPTRTWPRTSLTMSHRSRKTSLEL